MRIKQFHIPVYHGSLIVAQGNDFEAICKKLDVNWDDVQLGETTGAATITVEEDGILDFFMLFRMGADWREVAHESLHFVNRLFANRGVILDPENDEPQAYMLGWALSRCSETLYRIEKPLILLNYEVKEDE